ncbi:MAG: PEGA domain-containing protein [Polyangiaceae bacterium]
MALPSLNTARADDAAKGPGAASAAASAGSGSAADEASKHFRSGVAFYKSKDFAAAMVEFKRAYELAPNYAVLYNLGQTARELKDNALALSSYERYLREGDTKIPAARRKEVTTAIEELRSKVGKIKVVTNVSGAEIAVDDVTVGASPLPESVVVNIGRRKVSATLSGYVPVQRVLDVAGQEEATATLELTKIEPTKVQTSEPVSPPPPPPVLKTPTVVWVMLSATGALAVAAGVTGGLALSAHNGLQSELGKFPGDPAAIKSAQGQTSTFAITTDVLGGLALASAVTTTVLFFAAPRTPEKPQTTVGISPTGIVVQGAF